MAWKKKLHQIPPTKEPEEVLVCKGKDKEEKAVPADRVSIERNVRQMLCDKVSGNLMGLFLLIPDHLRLKTWDLICQWTGEPVDSLSPRLAMQMIHESSLCITSLRERSCVRHKGFEVLNGLGVVASDTQIHKLLDSHTVKEGSTASNKSGKPADGQW